MEDIPQLTQRQRKRRLRALNDCINIVQDVAQNLISKKQMLLAAVDATPLNEEVNKTLSLEQIDDYIKCYSQTYAMLSQAQGMVQKQLERVLEFKRAKTA